MISACSATLLFGFCFITNTVTASNVTTDRGITARTTGVRDETSARTTTTPSSVIPGDALCSSYVSKVPGSSLKPSEEAVISCQCSASPCPTVEFLNGEEFLFVVEKRFDLSSDSCSLQYTFRLRSFIKVGRERVTINCKVPDTDDVFGILDVYTDTPEPGSYSYRPKLSIYMILLIVAFLLLILSLLGFLLRWRIRSHRRSQRNAVRRSAFIQSQTNHGFIPSAYPTSNGDNPPSYEATLFQNIAGYPKVALTMNEKMEKPTTKCTGQNQPTAAE